MALRKLNLVMTYPVHWSLYMVMSNFVQNFYDAIGKEDFIKNFYYEFTKIYVNRAIYDKSAIVEGEPTYTFQYDRNKNDDFYGDVVVEYRVFDSTYYQVSINGIVDSYAVRRDVDKAVRLMRELK